jgi:hypothetical protein
VKNTFAGLKWSWMDKYVGSQFKIVYGPQLSEERLTHTDTDT